MATTGHESEVITVQGLKASLQKLKTDIIDGKQDAIGDLSNIRSNASAGATHAAVTSGNPHNVSKTDVGLGSVTNDAQVKRSEMGSNNGVATLDSTGKVPSTQLPSYVDDVLEYDAKSSFPSNGEAGKIYVDKATDTTWRWSGTAYTQIKGDLALGETSTTAYRGDRGKTAYDHSQSTHARTDATKTESSTTNGNIKINGTETTVYTHPTTAGNKHIPDGGSTGQLLGYSSSGTAQWINNTFVSTNTSGLKIELVSAMPSSPDANTIYIVQ